jgi:chemotaxis response regulator CheB
MSAKRKIRVLIVDDSAVARRAISEALGQDLRSKSSMRLRRLWRGRILKLDPDVITLDWNTRMDGVDLSSDSTSTIHCRWLW